MKLATDIAVRRKSDGRFLWTKRGVMMQPSESPKFLPTVDRAMLSVRIDMGLPLSDVEFVTRASLVGKAEGGCK